MWATTKAWNTSDGTHNTAQHTTCNSDWLLLFPNAKQGQAGIHYCAAPPPADPAAQITCDGDHVGSLSARENTNSSYFLQSPPFCLSACVCFSPQSVTLRLMMCNWVMKLRVTLTRGVGAVSVSPLILLMHFLVERHPLRSARGSGSPQRQLGSGCDASPCRHDRLLENGRGLAAFPPLQTFGAAVTLARSAEKSLSTRST